VPPLEVARVNMADVGADDHVGISGLRRRDLGIHDIDRLKDRFQDPLGKGSRYTGEMSTAMTTSAPAIARRSPRRG